MSALDQPSFAWLQDPAIQQVLKGLGYPQHDVRFVGGCVRDSLAGRPMGDFDLATPCPPTETLERLTRAGIKVIPTGLDHGTITAVVAGRSFEITTLRRDTACDGRHAVVEFTQSWREDASRRDFTINAMSLKPSGEVLDYFGGAVDLTAGKIRFVGAAVDRIQEDYLRILRLFRFQAHFGRAAIDDQTLHACAQFKDGLRTLSAERVTQELMKLLQAPDPVPSITAMQGCGVLQIVLPEAGRVNRLAVLIGVEKKYDLPPASLRRLACLLEKTDAAQLGQRLRLSNQQVSELQALLDDPTGDSANLNRALYLRGRTLTINRLALALAAADIGQQADGAGLIKRAKDWTPHPMPLSGNDLIAAGHQPGPAMGAALREAEELWISSGFKATRDQLLAKATHP